LVFLSVFQRPARDGSTEEMAAHCGLMLHTLEVERSFSVNDAKVSGLLERGQIDLHQDTEVGTKHGTVLIAIRLKIPEGYQIRLIAMNGDDCR
jgi:hypothetical protein